MDNTKQVTIRARKDGLSEQLEFSYPDILASIEAQLKCDINGFMLHFDEGNNQVYIGVVFDHSAKASLYRGDYANILEKAGLKLEDLFELKEGQEPPKTAKEVVNVSFT